MELPEKRGGGVQDWTVCRWEVSTRDSSGQCALGAPRREGVEIVRSEKEGLNIIIDSGDEGCLRIWPRDFILESEIWRDERIQVERTGYERESKYSFEQGESDGRTTLWKYGLLFFWRFVWVLYSVSCRFSKSEQENRLEIQIHEGEWPALFLCKPEVWIFEK